MVRTSQRAKLKLSALKAARLSEGKASSPARSLSLQAHSHPQQQLWRALCSQITTCVATLFLKTLGRGSMTAYASGREVLAAVVHRTHVVDNCGSRRFFFWTTWAPGTHPCRQNTHTHTKYIHFQKSVKWLCQDNTKNHHLKKLLFNQQRTF